MKSKPKYMVEKNKIRMRFAPSPSGPLHIGHALTLCASLDYCEKNHGKLLLRIDDTNPDNIYEPAYDMILKEFKWLKGNNNYKRFLQSERMLLYYKFIKNFIEQGNGYVCTCDSNKYKKLMLKNEPCPCRDLSVEEHLKRWRNMLDKDGYEQGNAVVRLKTNLNDKNPAMRDFPLARINLTRHPLQLNKYRVWPLMNLSTFADDVDLRITHIIRGKDHTDNAKRQNIMYKYLKLKSPITIFQGKLTFKDFKMSCSDVKEKIANGEYTGWDDIRLPFLCSLKKRGYKPEAIKKWAAKIGITLNDKSVTSKDVFKTINCLNKHIIDPVAKRFFFIEKPLKVDIVDMTIVTEDIGMINILDLHPQNIKGGRKFKLFNKFLIEENDYNDLENNEIYRLKDCLNFINIYSHQLSNNNLLFHSIDYETFKKSGGKKVIHWLPDDEKQLLNCEILMPENFIIKGIVEKNIRCIKENEIVQFVRFGFCKLSKKSRGLYKFIFLHR